MMKKEDLGRLSFEELVDLAMKPLVKNGKEVKKSIPFINAIWDECDKRRIAEFTQSDVKFRIAWRFIKRMNRKELLRYCQKTVLLEASHKQKRKFLSEKSTLALQFWALVDTDIS